MANKVKYVVSRRPTPLDTPLEFDHSEDALAAVRGLHPHQNIQFTPVVIHDGDAMVSSLVFDNGKDVQYVVTQIILETETP